MLMQFSNILQVHLSSGAVIRDHSGQVLLSAWKVNQRCTTAEDAVAFFKGIQHSSLWSNGSRNLL
jgi:hypothetical protein